MDTSPPGDHESGPAASLRGWRLGVFVASWPIAAGVAGIAGGAGLEAAPAVMLGIVLIGAALWVTEATSAMATSLLVIALCVTLLGLPATFEAAWAREHTRITGWEMFIAPAGSGIMLLLLGSMTLGVAVQRTGLDQLIGERLLRPFMSSASRVGLGLMLVSAFLSLWMSNTATAAIMLGVARALAPRYAPVDSPAPDRRVSAGLALAVALGANVGGIGSPVGTPPGAIVFTSLEKMGEPVSFLEWMAVGVPVAVVVLIAGWLAMSRGLGLPPPIPLDAQRPPDYPGSSKAHPHGPGAARRRWTTGVVFVVTVGLWLTSGVTRIPVEAAALLPLAILPLIGVIRPRDMALVDWDVLLLILGGLVLGIGMEASGLAERAVAAAPLDGLSGPALVLMIAGAGLILSAFMSNTATANLLAPIGLGLAASLAARYAEPGETSRLATAAGFAIALGAGASMPIAVATPANAMAARDGVLAREFLVVGLAVGAAVLVSMGVLAWLTV